MASIWILGGGSIGSAVAKQKSDSGYAVTLISRRSRPVSEQLDQRVIVSWDWSDVIEQLESLPIPDQVLVTNGVLWSDKMQPEKRTQALSQESLLNSFSANVLVTAACLQHLSGRLKRDSHVTFMSISAKVGSISDNRLGGWHAYRVSKAALNMLVKTTAIEWQRRFPQCALASYHPGTTDSDLSKPFQQRLAEGQLKTAEEAAICLVDVLDNHVTPETSGSLFNWNGSRLPF